MYESELLKYFQNDDLYQNKSEKHFKLIKNKLINDNIRNKALKYKIDIRIDHRKYLKKYFFTYPDKRDHLVIRFFANVTKISNSRLFPICDCGEENSPEHTSDTCNLKMDDTQRRFYIKRFDEYYDIMTTERRNGLYEYLTYSFFTLTTDNVKTLRKLSQLTKEIISRMIMDKQE